MNDLLQQRFFRLLSEYSQREIFATELVGAIEELALHLADFSIDEQDNMGQSENPVGVLCL